MLNVIKLLALILISISFLMTSACEYNPYPNSGYPTNYPPSYPSYPPTNYPPNNYPYYPPAYPQNYPNQYPNNGYYYPNSQRYDHRNNHDHDDRRDGIRKPPFQPRPNPGTINPPPPPPPQEQVIRPNCPSGTNYDGRTCKIVDDRLRKPGGDGNINPCPKGMWVSGDKCVK